MKLTDNNKNTGIYLVILFSCSLLLSACAQTSTGIKHSSNDTPDWLNGEPDMYPNFKYLTATDSALNLETAKDRALSGLARIFEVRIREVSTTRQNVQSHRSNGTETVRTAQQLATTVNLSTDKMVQGARIAEQWHDPDDLNWYALAVLDRTQAGNNIRQQIHELDRQTNYFLQQVENQRDPLLHISDLYTASQLQHNRQVLQKTLKVIDIKGKGVPSQWNLIALDEQLHQAMRNLPVQTTVSDDTVGGLKTILQGAAAEAGFKPGNRGYQLMASIKTQPPIYRDNWYWLRGSLKLSFLATDRHTVLGYKSWPLKISAQSEIQLTSRMQKSIDKKLKQELLPSILSFIAKPAQNSKIK